MTGMQTGRPGLVIATFLNGEAAPVQLTVQLAK